ncbi:MAG TPA: hypothetical protein VGF75_06630 [Candidatus Saccharimonadales bacterium]|jgi:hypothetical protein
MSSSIAIDDKAMKLVSAFAAKHGLEPSQYVESVVLEAIDEEYIPGSEAEPTPYLEEMMRDAEVALLDGRASKAMNREEALAHLRSMID